MEERKVYNDNHGIIILKYPEGSWQDTCQRYPRALATLSEKLLNSDFTISEYTEFFVRNLISENDKRNIEKVLAI